MNDPTLHKPPSAQRMQIIGVACGHGGKDHGTASGPDALFASELLKHLNSRGLPVTWPETITADPTAGSDLDVVARVCEQLLRRIDAIVAKGDLPIVLGGDHSAAVGTWKGVARACRAKGPIGLLWIDAHMDAHTPQTSPSGALHGMPLACLLGHGEPALTSLGDGIRLNPWNICLIGVRSFESSEARLLSRLGVHIFYMNEIERRGLDAVISEATAIVQKGTAGFGVSLDLDALDPLEVPGVSTPVPGGISVGPLYSALKRLAGNPGLLAVELVEYNPNRDQHAHTALVVSQLLDACLGAPLVRSSQTMPEIEYRYGAHHYDPLPVVLVRGEGVYLWDEDGRRYIDMMSAYSAVSHGHCHPRLIRALTEQACTLAVTSRAFHNNRLPLFLKRLCEITGQDMALPVNTGLEAVETALKAARKWGYKVKGIADNQAEIIACANNFHGRSIGILAMSTEHQYRDGFGPFPPGFRSIPYGDAEALADAITPRTAAFLVEPIQGEGGIVVPPPGYLARCAEICRRNNVLLICDEVQTGLGRTGRILACEHDGVKPDGVILGKALGGGLLPVSAFLARREVMEVFASGDHGSTFGGNPLAAAVALEALNVLVEEQLAYRAADLGEYLMSRLRDIQSPLIRQVRGKGLLIGIELDVTQTSARAACERLLQHGILTKDTHGTVLRFAPPLTITREIVDEALVAIRAAFRELDSMFRCAA